MTIHDPRISVCTYKDHVSIGCFNGLAGDCVRYFIEYPREEEYRGIAEAMGFFWELTMITPTIVRPTITRMKKTYSKTRK